jgi:uncharacterized protein (TIGR02271 family)
MVERWRGRITTGMQVKGSDGEKLGRVVECTGAGFVVEKGFLFPKDVVVPYDRVADVRGNEILISLARAELGDPSGNPAAKPAEEVTRLVPRGAREGGGEPRAARSSLDQFGKGGEIRMALVEEEIVAKKHVEKVGEVHVRKDVVTEEKQITVPVTREVLRVERVSVAPGDERSGDGAFESEAYDIPISEERIVVEKHPVVREEVRIGKEIQQGEEVARATVRRERADVETQGPVRRAEAANETIPERLTGTGGPKR